MTMIDTMVQCPRCGIQVTDLQALDPETMAKLQAAGENISTAVCSVCASDLRKMLSQSKGGVLLAQERAKEQYRLDLWKNRVSLIKKARSLMGGKNYSQAAITYEKYLKVLEIVFGLSKGDILNPTHFKESARTSEITVVASVYWDLLRIYDTNERYSERQQAAAKQLATFIQYTPIYPDIMKKAQAFAKSAKNPQTIKAFIKEASSQRPRCFIASSTFQDNFAPDVVYLRLFRDYFLTNYQIGNWFIRAYYVGSPIIAKILDHSQMLRFLAKSFIKALIKCIRLIY